jgi:soluble lytic murein transglycosylase
VVRLLDGETWLDGYQGGSGRALLARARVERGEDAVADARAAVSTSPEGELGHRVVTLARAFDRARLLDSAARAYRRAALLLPTVSDWLLLRAAGVSADSAERRALYHEVTLPAAVPRIRWTEALARDRSGDQVGAARLYDSLGATVSAMRLRLGVAPDAASRAGLRTELVASLTPALSPEDTRTVVELLDRNFSPLRRAEELAVARRAAAADRLARSAQGFARAAPLADSDRLTHGTVLARLGRHPEAIAVFRSIKSGELLAKSGYQRARSLLRIGTRDAAMAALRQVFDSRTGDSATAASAGFYRADLLVDSGDEGAARAAYLEVAKRFPGTSHGSRAAFQAALILYLQDDAGGAARELRALTEQPGDRTEATAAMYWSGRAMQAAGDSAGARARWQTVIDRFPSSYYAVPAAVRLGVPPTAVTADSLPPPDAEVIATVERGALLERLGLRVEARFEHDRVSRSAESAPATLQAVAAAFSTRGLTARAYRLATRSGDAALQRLRFPLPQISGFLDEAREAGIDPLLAAALIRQESGFDPGARSAADARGLMQVLPGVGAALAHADGLREWESALLYEPELNLRFGLQHLAVALRRFPSLEPALAGYNAGTRAAERWLRLTGAKADPEVYIERIQFAETRDYVRRILRNLAVYRALYPGTG